MAIYQSVASKKSSSFSSAASTITANTGVIEIVGGDIEADDTIELLRIPAGEIPVDLILYVNTPLDTDGTPTITFDVGVGDKDGTIATGDEDLFMADSDFCQTGATNIVHVNKPDLAFMDSSNEDRLVILTATEVAATGATGTIKAVLLSKG